MSGFTLLQGLALSRVVGWDVEAGSLVAALNVGKKLIR